MDRKIETIRKKTLSVVEPWESRGEKDTTARLGRSNSTESETVGKMGGVVRCGERSHKSSSQTEIRKSGRNQGRIIVVDCEVKHREERDGGPMKKRRLPILVSSEHTPTGLVPHFLRFATS